MTYPKLISTVCFVTLACVAWSDDRDDAAQLRDESTAILKKNSAGGVPPAEYAMAIYRLEKAQSMLEAAKDTDCPLAQEVNSALFWARKCSNVNILKELDKIHAANPALKLASAEPKPKKPAQATVEGIANPEMPELNLQADAKAAFEQAQQFASEHIGDDYVISMRWFQMVNEFPGTDYSLKAVQLARDAQMRYAAKQGGAPKETLGDGPEAKGLAEGDTFCQQGKFEEAIAAYKQSLKLKETAAGHRKLGHAYYQRAQQRKDEVNKELEEFVPKFKEAYDSSWYMEGSSKSSHKKFNALSPQWLAAKRRHGEIMAEAEHVWTIYVYGQWEFEKVLKLSPNNRDFDAAAYEGISLSVRGEDQGKAKAYLTKFLKEYEPTNDMERFVYEYAKTELDRLLHS